MSDDDETRQHPRYAAEIDVELTANGRKVPGRTRNLSKGGFCCEVPGLVNLGTEVGIMLSLVFDESTYSEPLQLRGRVLWSTPLDGNRCQIGLTFLGLNQDMKNYLEMFLRFLREGQEKAAALEESQDSPLDERADKGDYFE